VPQLPQRNVEVASAGRQIERGLDGAPRMVHAAPQRQKPVAAVRADLPSAVVNHVGQIP